MAYRMYVADSLQAIPQSQYLVRRFSELLQPRQEIDVCAIIDHVAALVGSED